MLYMSQYTCNCYAIMVCLTFSGYKISSLLRTKWHYCGIVSMASNHASAGELCALVYMLLILQISCFTLTWDAVTLTESSIKWRIFCTSYYHILIRKASSPNILNPICRYKQRHVTWGHDGKSLKVRLVSVKQLVSRIESAINWQGDWIR